MISLEYFLFCINAVLLDEGVSNVLLHLLFSICGLYMKIFYCFLPIFVASRFPELNVINSAVFDNKELISATSCIGLLIIYAQSIVAFNFLDIVYYDVNIEGGERVC